MERIVEVLPIRMDSVASAMAPRMTAWAWEAKYRWWLSPTLKKSKPASSAALAYATNSRMRSPALMREPSVGFGRWSPRVYMPNCRPWLGSKFSSFMRFLDSVTVSPWVPMTFSFVMATDNRGRIFPKWSVPGGGRAVPAESTPVGESPRNQPLSAESPVPSSPADVPSAERLRRSTLRS